MTSRESELRSLRARAYGPDADIHTDPAALARLAELEDALRPAPSPPTDPPALASTPTAGPPASPPAANEAAPTESGTPPPAGSPAPAPTKPPRGRRRLAIAWAVSLVAALVIGAVAASTTVRLVSRDAGAAQVAALELSEPTAWPGFLGPQADDARVSQDFFGMTAVTTTEGSWFGGEDPCLVVMPTEQFESDSDSFSGPQYFGCGAGAFAATVQFTVDTEQPLPLRSRFAVGSSLQFVFDGDRVGVFSDAG
ncbi:hypothetical protein ACTU3I_07770 [Microbacterium sp. RD1]|uniref:hypothetical protein n=1 Tax=Microbacterium sp. RD1 TaxID=3457313 RepID=UPI003FA53B46